MLPVKTINSLAVSPGSSGSSEGSKHGTQLSSTGRETARAQFSVINVIYSNSSQSSDFMDDKRQQAEAGKRQERGEMAEERSGLFSSQKRLV